jgi:TP901 family phage tail tape measure protein
VGDSKITFILSAIDRGASKTAHAVSGALSKMEGSAQRAGRALKRLGADLLKVGAVGLAALGVALAGAVKAAMDFERAMLNVNSIVKGSPAVLESMRQSVLKLSKELPQSAETLAQGLYDIASSGFKGADGVKVLEAAARSASAGLATTAESAAGLTAVLNAYGLKAAAATKISDIMFKVVDRGVITFPELAENIGKVTAVSAPLGVRFAEVAAGLALMTRRGVGAEEATTQLNAIMVAILKPSKEAAKLAKEIGLNWTTQGLKARGLAGMMVDLTRKTKGNKEQMATLLGDTRAIRGAFVLATRGGKDFTTELAAMNKAAGATDAALSVQKQGLAFQMGILGNNITAVGIKIGSVLIPMITPLVVKFSSWLDKNDKLVAGIGKFAGQTLLGLGSIIGRVIRVIGDVVTRVNDWVERNKPLINQIRTLVGTTLAALAKAIGNVVAWFGRLVTSITSNKEAMDALRRFAKAIGDLFLVAWDAIKKVTTAFGSFMSSVSSNKDTMSFLARVLNGISHRIEILVAGLRQLVQWADAAFTALARLGGAYGGNIPANNPPRMGHGQHGGVWPAGSSLQVGEVAQETLHLLPQGGGIVVPNGSGRSGGSSVTVIHTHIHLNGREIAEVVDKHNYRRDQRSAPTALRA